MAGDHARTGDRLAGDRRDQQHRPAGRRRDVLDLLWCDRRHLHQRPTHSEATAWKGNGQELWATQIRGATTFSSPVLDPASATNIWNDVLVGSPYGLYPINGQNGSYMFGTSASVQHSAINFTCRVYNAAAVADLPTQGTDFRPYVFEACGGPAAFHHVGEIVAYRLPPTSRQSGMADVPRRSTHDGVTSMSVSNLSSSD